MANIYDVASAIQQPNPVGAFQQGIQTARSNAMGNIALQQAQQQQTDEQTLRGLAPGIISGDPNAYAKAAAINPDQAASYQGAGDDQLRRLKGAIDYIDSQKDPRAKEAAYQGAVRPYLARIGAASGKVPPATFAEAEPLMEQARAQIATIGLPKNVPAGVQEFNMLATAAGYKPGSPEFQKAAQVHLGTAARVVAGGAKTGMITGADGRQRPYIFDPGTQTYSVFDGGTWRPMGQAEAAQAAAQPVGGQLTTTDGVTSDLASKANEILRLTGDQAYVDNWLKRQASGLPGYSPAGVPAPTTTPNVGLAVGRSPEEQAALTEAAKQGAITAALPTQEAIKTAAAVQKEGQGTTAKGMAERSLGRPQAELAYNDAAANLDRMADSARELLGRTGLEGITGIQSRIPNFPGSQASNAQANLDNLKSQIGFAVLQAMRNASKTGGALGSVSDAEGVRLENNLAALQQSQSTEELRRGLQKIIDYAGQAKGRLKNAFDQTYSGQQAPVTQAAAAGNPATNGWSAVEVQ